MKVSQDQAYIVRDIWYAKKDIKRKEKYIAYLEANGWLEKGSIPYDERVRQVWELWALRDHVEYLKWRLVAQPEFHSLEYFEAYKKYTVLLASIYLFPWLKDIVKWMEREKQGKKGTGIRIMFAGKNGTVFYRVYEDELQNFTLLKGFFHKQARILL